MVPLRATSHACIHVCMCFVLHACVGMSVLRVYCVACTRGHERAACVLCCMQIRLLADIDLMPCRTVLRSHEYKLPTRDTALSDHWW